MSDNALAYPFELNIANRQLFYDRTLELARRVESVTGPIAEFATRLERGRVTTAEVARVYGAIVRDDPDGPSTEVIDAWVFAKGVFCHQRTAAFLFSLIVGSDNLAVESKKAAGSATKEDGDGRGPFVPTG